MDEEIINLCSSPSVRTTGRHDLSHEVINLLSSDAKSGNPQFSPQHPQPYTPQPKGNVDVIELGDTPLHKQINPEHNIFAKYDVLPSSVDRFSPVQRRKRSRPGSPIPFRLAADAEPAGSANKPKPKRVKRTPTVKLSSISRDRNQTVKELTCTICGDAGDLAEALHAAEVATTTASGDLAEGLCATISIVRNTTSSWDAQLRAYVEGPMHAEPEPTKILIFDASQCPLFTQQHYAATLASLERIYGSDCIYIAQGFKKLYRKDLNAFNRALQQRARAAVRGTTVDAPLVRAPDANAYMQAQVTLELRHKRKIIYTEKPSETNEWVVNLLKDISSSRYLNRAYADIVPGLVKSQKESKDIVLEAMFQFPGVSRRNSVELGRKFDNLGEFVANASHMPLPASERYRAMIDKLVRSTDPNELV